MYFFIFLLLLTWQFYSRVPFITALCESGQENCGFEHTVNLTNIQRFRNGSNVLQGHSIPTEKQDFYDRDEDSFLSHLHLICCVCDKRPCMKLCCAEDEYYEDTKNTSKCEEIMADLNVSWGGWTVDDAIQTDVNIFQHFLTKVSFPCQLPRALVLQDKTILLGNGSLMNARDKSQLATREKCYSTFYDNKFKKFILTSFECPVHFHLNTYATVLSVLFLIPTIVVYFVLEELRGNLVGKLMICYLISLTMSYIIITFINFSNLRFNVISCSLLGFAGYFFFIASFIWLSVLCIDMWKSFQEFGMEIDSHRDQKQFVIYSLYAWLSAVLATGFVVCMQMSPNVAELYKPGIGVEMCFLNTSKWSAFIYLYGPSFIILLFNLITFAYLAATIYIVRRNVAEMTQKVKFYRENAFVILRLFVVMDILWGFEILSFVMREHKKYYFIYTIADIVAAIRGISIFSLFVLKRKVLNSLKKRFSAKPKASVSSAATHFPKLRTATSVSRRLAT